MRNCLEDSSEVSLDLSTEPPVPITKALLEKAFEFTDLTVGFTPQIPKPLRNKSSMLQVTAPALANYAESFSKVADDYEALSHMILIANFLNN